MTRPSGQWSPQEEGHPRTKVTPGRGSPQEKGHLRKRGTSGRGAPQVNLRTKSPQDEGHPRTRVTLGRRSPQDEGHLRTKSLQDEGHLRTSVTWGRASPQDEGHIRTRVTSNRSSKSIYNENMLYELTCIFFLLGAVWIIILAIQCIHNNNKNNNNNNSYKALFSNYSTHLLYKHLITKTTLTYISTKGTFSITCLLHKYVTPCWRPSRRIEYVYNFNLRVFRCSRIDYVE